MVDAIRYGSARPPAPGPSGTRDVEDRKAAALSASAPPLAAAEQSELSQKAAVAALREQPPVDIEAVTRIREAIARGDYPIDLDSVAERLMESYRQLQG